MKKISGVYKITNNTTSDCYIGSSVNIYERWQHHKLKSTWKRYSNSRMYQDMTQYSLNNFLFEIIEETSDLKEREQYWIDKLKPAYNNYRANGQDIERYKEYNKEYQKEYKQTEKYKETNRKACNKYNNQLCLYNGEKIKLATLFNRFYKAGIEHPIQEAKRYLIGE